MKKPLTVVALAAAAFVLSTGVAYAHHADQVTIDCDSVDGLLVDFQPGDYTVTLAGTVDSEPFTLEQTVTIPTDGADTPVSFEISSLTDAQGADTTVVAHLAWQGPEEGSSDDTTFTGPCGEAPPTTSTTVQPTPPPVDEPPVTVLEPPVVPEPSYGGGDVAPEAPTGEASSARAVAPAEAQLPHTGSNWLLTAFGAACAFGGFALLQVTRQRGRGYWESTE